MAVNPTAFQRRAKAGGGGIGGAIGSVLGAIGGAIAAPFTGGASLLPAISAGMGIGKAAGGAIGGSADPGRAGGEGNNLPTSSLAKRAEQSSSPNHSQILEQSLMALKDVSPEVQEAYKMPLIKAYGMSRQGGQ